MCLKSAELITKISLLRDGNDGPWSSFALRLGTPSQNVRVFISTTSPETWAVDPQGCTASDPPDCAASRGAFYNINSSTSRVQSGILELNLEENLAYSGNGVFGFDTVGLGWQGSGGPTLEHRVVASIATKDFYLGHFGVAAKAINLTDFNDPQPSFLSTLKEKNMIPSLSFGYTAGARYRMLSFIFVRGVLRDAEHITGLKGTLGSLTLGGYDDSRSITNGISFNFAADNSRDLVVGIQSINMVSNLSSAVVPLLKDGILSFIDSTVPHIWLPLTACQAFERAFGIIFDPVTQLYLVNDSLHSALIAQNAHVTFAIGNIISSEQTVDIILPYASFDLHVGYPIVPNSTRYFPLRRAKNESQYTLGRTFLQEAYVQLLSFPLTCLSKRGLVVLTSKPAT